MLRCDINVAVDAISIATVPEPSTSAIMILGFAALASWRIAGSQRWA
jgi:hypothetical protein